MSVEGDGELVQEELSGLFFDPVGDEGWHLELFLAKSLFFMRLHDKEMQAVSIDFFFFLHLFFRSCL